MERNHKIIKVAEALRNASKDKLAIGPVRPEFEVGDVEAAYEAQRINNKLRQENGVVAVGKKIGLTSKKVQAQLGVDQPDFGVLFQDMEIKNGGTLSWEDTMQPKVEAEVAFILKDDITSPNPSIQDVEDAIDYAVASIEVVGSRIKDWDITILDTVADNASASHFVLGGEKKKLSEIDLINCQMQMKVNGVLVSEGEGKACLGSPLIATQWLAEQMAAVGNPLKKGDVILSGALGPMGAVSQGDEVVASIGGLGEVRLQFSK